MKIGRYEVLREIGRGGMGLVLEGRSPEGKRVAIKVLQKTDKKTALQRFERERRLLASLRERDGFVPLLDYGNDAPALPASGIAASGSTSRGHASLPYLVMPF
ncbi:hypothetical protein HY251_03555, partial [bacterium]|nr:hypothetical protein [bacterium]